MTGVIQSLGITWGLFRQYLILVQLLLTVLAIIILLLQMELISYLAAGDTDGARPWRLPVQALEKLVINGISNFLLDRQLIAEALETEVPADN